MKKLLKSQDMFGIPLQLKFKKEETHNTIYGGILSIILKMLFFVFTAHKFIVLLNKSDSNIKTSDHGRP